MGKKFLGILVIVILIVPGSFQLAKTFNGVTMDDSINIDGQRLVLNGMGVKKVFVFKIFVAGLYLPKKERDSQKVLEDMTIRCTVTHFVRDVKAHKIRKSLYEGLENNTPDCLPEIEEKFKLLCSWIEDVKKGDLMRFTYIPGKGAIVELKGKEKGVIGGEGFSRALLACWLGPEPEPGEKFKDGLMGNND